MMKVLSSRYAELSAERRAQLEALARSEFGRYPLVRETAWAEPHWSFLGFDGSALVCFYNAVERLVRFDDQPTPVVGVNNLVTLPAYRGRGLASRILRETELFWFQTLKVRYGVLLCADALVTFYLRLGWKRIGSSVRFSQPDGERLWAANCMLLAPDRREINPREVDLCGLPW